MLGGFYVNLAQAGVIERDILRKCLQPYIPGSSVTPV